MIAFTTLLSITLGYFVLNCAITFLPTFAESNDRFIVTDYHLDELDVSFILSTFSLAQILFSPLNTFFKNRLGAKNTILLGFLLLSTTTIGLGFIAKTTNPKLFLVVSIILRFFQGWGETLVGITGYSIITSTFSDEMVKYLGYTEVCTSLGVGLGPALGQVVYSAF